MGFIIYLIDGYDKTLKNKHAQTNHVLKKEWTVKEAIEYGINMEDKAIRFYTTISGIT